MTNVLRGYANIVIAVGKAGARIAKQFANLVSADQILEFANDPVLLCKYLSESDDPLAMVHWLYKVFSLIEHFEIIYTLVQFNTLLTAVAPAGVIAMQTSMSGAVVVSLSISLSPSPVIACLSLSHSGVIAMHVPLQWNRGD